LTYPFFVRLEFLSLPVINSSSMTQTSETALAMVPAETSKVGMPWLRRSLGSPVPSGLIIFAVAYVIRAAFILHSSLDLALGEPRNVAIALVEHRGFADPFRCPTGPTAHCSPFLPVLIAAIYSVFGTGYAGELARCLLCLMVLCLCYALLPWFAVRLELPSSVGAAAGLICALFPFKRTSETTSFSDEPFVALILLPLTVFSVRLLKRKSVSWGEAFLYGLAWGTALYLGVSLLPIWLGTIVLRVVTSRSSVAAKLALSLAAAGVTASPWVLRNYQDLHAITLMRSNFGLELSLANSDGARPSLKQNLSTGHQPDNHPLTSAGECAAVQQMGEAGYNRRKLDNAIQWIKGHPLGFSELTAWRVFYFWAGDPRDYWTAVPNELLSIAGWVGCVLLIRRRFYAGAVVACAFALYPLVYYVTQSTPRYSLPIHPLIALCAAYSMYAYRNANWISQETK